MAVLCYQQDRHACCPVLGFLSARRYSSRHATLNACWEHRAPRGGWPAKLAAARGWRSYAMAGTCTRVEECRGASIACAGICILAKHFARFL